MDYVDFIQIMLMPLFSYPAISAVSVL